MKQSILQTHFYYVLLVLYIPLIFKELILKKFYLVSFALRVCTSVWKWEQCSPLMGS